MVDDEHLCPYCGSDDIKLAEACESEQDYRNALKADSKKIVVKLACAKCYGFWDNTYVKGGDKHE